MFKKKRKISVLELEEYMLQKKEDFMVFAITGECEEKFFPEYFDMTEEELEERQRQKEEWEKKKNACGGGEVRYNLGTTSFDDYLPEEVEYDKIKDARDAAMLFVEERLGRDFGEELERLVKEKGIKPSKFQSDACISAATYSNIIRNGVKPTRETALACAVGLGLSIAKADELLSKAGYNMSISDMRDVIIMCYLDKKEYNVKEINDVLYERGLPLIGQRSK